MSAFLDHIAGRAAGTAPMLLPRKRSIFEPVPGLADSTPEPLEASVFEEGLAPRGDPGPATRRAPETAVEVPPEPMRGTNVATTAPPPAPVPLRLGAPIADIVQPAPALPSAAAVAPSPIALTATAPAVALPAHAIPAASRATAGALQRRETASHMAATIDIRSSSPTQAIPDRAGSGIDRSPDTAGSPISTPPRRRTGFTPVEPVPLQTETAHRASPAATTPLPAVAAGQSCFAQLAKATLLTAETAPAEPKPVTPSTRPVAGQPRLPETLRAPPVQPIPPLPALARQVDAPAPIEVHIGRVEIVADRTPTASAPAAPVSQGPSLDAFLARQRR
ncbi:hypothetical protein [Sphingomonas sp. SUN039]|uniref:hypothetical protein n=1 Tax=Sphingomonas sp. SUN039 TaxID=2937787 RepID=UPI0021649EBF|nr:hypothetical protein [Sphingomonas sp. SUN039]UVO55979.1 hypothetical protein M0209_16870 [Sphingomonas sp. SUN039]